jgi:radial spoke head protein 9
MRRSPPARRQQSKGRKGSVRLRYSLSDGGPVERMLPGWLPQLQLHMLTSGCQSALLLSRSPSAGVRVFRVSLCGCV